MIELFELNNNYNDEYNPISSYNSNVVVNFQKMTLINGVTQGVVNFTVNSAIGGWQPLLKGLSSLGNAKYNVGVYTLDAKGIGQRHYSGMIQTNSAGLAVGTYTIFIPF